MKPLLPGSEHSDCFGSWPDCPITCLWADNLSRLFPLRKRLPTFHRSATEISSGMWPTGIFTRLHVCRYTNLTKGSLLKEKSISCKTLALHFFSRLQLLKPTPLLMKTECTNNGFQLCQASSFCEPAPFILYKKPFFKASAFPQSYSEEDTNKLSWYLWLTCSFFHFENLLESCGD